MEQKIYQVSKSQPLDSAALSMAPPEMAESLNMFGFPPQLKKLHRSIKEIINRIPHTNEKGLKTRDMFLALLTNDRSEAVLAEKIAHVIAYDAVKDDLLQERITQMTPAEYIVPLKSEATPNELTLNSVRESLLKADHERFAKVDASKQSDNEWNHIKDSEEDNKPHPF